MKSVAIIEVNEVRYRRYRILRSSCFINNNTSKFLKNELFELHLELFYPGVLDRNKPTMPPIIFYVKPYESLTESEKIGKDGKIRVRHPMLL